MGAPGPPGPLGSKGREVGHYGLVGNISLIELNRFALATRRHNRITTQWHNGIIACFGDENIHIKTWGRSHCFLIPLCSCCHVAFFTMSYGKHAVHLMSSCFCPHFVMSLVWTSVYRVVLRENKPFLSWLLYLCVKTNCMKMRSA